MDLDTVTEVARRPDRSALADWRDGDAWLGGGTWIFSEPQPRLRRLIDLDGFGWTPLEDDADGLTIAATCKIAELYSWPRASAWTSGRLIDQCCRALLGSFKVWNMATVGGNLCLSLPAGPMTSLSAALGGDCTIWEPGGTERTVAADRFVTGDRANVLAAGELLRSIRIPAESLRSRAAFRQVSLTPLGRSAALLIATLAPSGAFVLTITAATVRPIRLAFSGPPRQDELFAAIERDVARADYHDDVHGHPDWRRHLTFELAEDIRRELADGAAP